MVCGKTDDCNKDMTKVGIDLVVDGEWLRADKTTLGADDGIGMVIILAVLTDKNDYEREVIGIFTDDEEVGLVGAHTTKERLKIATVRMCHMQIKELFKELK